MSEIVCEMYRDMLNSREVQSQILSLQQLPHNFAFEELYGSRSEEMTSIIEKYISNVDKFLFVIPEYNGSFPGVLKTFIDAVPPKLFREKKAAIIGVSDGRAGNLRGQEHLTGILHYLKMHVHYSKPKISGIDNLVDNDKKINDQGTLDVLRHHAEVFVAY